jgi:hypothetical protein
MDAQIINIMMALALTIVLELFAFLIFIKSRVPKDRWRLWVLFIIGVNFFTNPLAHLIYYYLATQITAGLSWIITEFFVILIEAILIKLLMKVHFIRALIFSVVLNGTSILLGELILWCL